MAGSYTGVTSQPAIEILGGTRTRAVQEIGAFTVPSNIYFEVRVVIKGADAIDPTLELSKVSEDIEGGMSNPHVVTMTYDPDTNAAGNIVDIMDVTIQSTSGLSTGDLRMTYGDLDPLVRDRLIEPVVHQLDAIEAL